MITTTDLYVILKRSKWLGTGIFGVAMLAGTIVAIIMPLRYEAVIGIEKRQAQISLQPVFSEYDVTRFTSENERTIAVLRSRYMLVEWLKAIGLPWKTPRQMERQLKKLDKRFVIRPINFTDLYLMKVQAESPAEAGHRAELIVQLFQKWDETQAQNESEEVIALLKKRLEVVRADLSRKRDLIRESKLSRTINLSGSTSESELETDIRAKQNLYDHIFFTNGFNLIFKFMYIIIRPMIVKMNFTFYLTRVFLWILVWYSIM